VQAFIIFTTALVLLGVSAYLVGSMIWSIRRERQVRKRWANFGLSIAFCVLFFVSWAAQALVQWGVYRDQQEQHGEAPTVSGYVIEFGQATLENWQSEFLQLFSFVVLSALLIHKGSAESKDSDDEILATVKRIEKRLDAGSS
jgi:hypothetical protein